MIQLWCEAYSVEHLCFCSLNIINLCKHMMVCQFNNSINVFKYSTFLYFILQNDFVFTVYVVLVYLCICNLKG